MVDACARPASASHRPRPARCTSAPPWWRSPTPWALAVSAGELLLRIDDTDAARTVADAEQGILDDLAWLGLELTRRARAPERAAGAPPRRRARVARHGACVSLLLPTVAGAVRRPLPGAAARRLGTPPRGGRAERRALPRPGRRGRRGGRDARARCASRATRSPTSCSCAPTGGRRSISPPAWTTATSRSRTSCAARITSRTRRVTCSCCARSGAVEPVFAHCPIIVGADGERLSTRRGAEPLAALRARGVPPEAVVAYAAQLACPAQGGAGEVASFEELAGRFSLARLGRGTAHADPAHLAWLGREVLAALPLDELAGRLAAVPAGGHAGSPSCTALAEAARGASSLGEVADSAMRVGTATRRTAAGRSGAGALLRAARGRRAPSSCPTRRPQSSSLGCASTARAAASRPATCYTL